MDAARSLLRRIRRIESILKPRVILCHADRPYCNVADYSRHDRCSHVAKIRIAETGFIVYAGAAPAANVEDTCRDEQFAERWEPIVRRDHE